MIALLPTRSEFGSIDILFKQDQKSVKVCYLIEHGFSRRLTIDDFKKKTSECEII